MKEYTKLELKYWNIFYKTQYPVFQFFSEKDWETVSQEEQTLQFVFDFNKIVRNYLRMERLCQ
jgi:hypothetical protein